MTYLYALPVAAVDPDDSAVRARIAPERLALLDARRGHARAQGIAATLLLTYAVAQRVPDASLPLSIALAEGGKPYLPALRDVHFSLSHSGGWVVCALSDRPVGVDIEQRTPGRRDVAGRFFHEDEVRYLNSLPEKQREDSFYAFWVLKEAFVKATGRGLALPLRTFCIALGEPPTLCGHENAPCTFALVPFAADLAYRIGLCMQGAENDAYLLEILE